VQALPTDPSRLPRLLEELRKSQSGAVRPGRPAGFLIPVAGNVQGANGTYFQSDVTLANWKTSSQDVLLAWLPQGLDGTSGPSFRLTLPPSTVSTATTIRDLIGKLGLYGVGSLVVIAIGADENLDPAGAIDGFSRIWTRQPGSSGSVSQSFAAISTDALREQDDAIALGLRQDDEFRTNVAIVNLDTQPRQFLVVARGDEGGATTTVDVPALSIVQVALPEQARGAITVTFHPVGGTTAFSWAACGSSIDNVTGDSWFSVAAPAPSVNSSANHSTE